MKNLQKFAAQQMSKKQMNKIYGGVDCPAGMLYGNCSVIHNGIYVHLGVGCFRSQEELKEQMQAYYSGEEVSVGCVFV